MKHISAIFLLALLSLNSCDHIDTVGDKVNELKDRRMESTQGIDGLKIGQILDGVTGGPAVQDIPQTEFQTFISQPGRLNIVDFHADWCGPCRQLAPILAEVVEANANVCRLGKINVDHAKELAQAEGVQGIPDVRFYVDGQLVHRFLGGESKVNLENLIKEHSPSIMPINDHAAREDTPASAPTRQQNTKPIDEAMKPMKKDWLPPGVTPKK